MPGSTATAHTSTGPQMNARGRCARHSSLKWTAATRHPAAASARGHSTATSAAALPDASIYGAGRSVRTPPPLWLVVGMVVGTADAVVGAAVAVVGMAVAGCSARPLAGA